jgi:hypothetical protein
MTRSCPGKIEKSTSCWIYEISSLITTYSEIFNLHTYVENLILEHTKFGDLDIVKVESLVLLFFIIIFRSELVGLVKMILG